MDGRLRLEAGGRCVVSLSTIYRAAACGDLNLPGWEPVRRLLRRRGRSPPVPDPGSGTGGLIRPSGPATSTW